MRRRLHLRCGDWVQVRSKDEIVATLDSHGQLDALPFMPEMLQFCGRRYQVSKRAEKACDTIYKTGARRMIDAVHLDDLRCDGSAHGGCQAGCLLFWKEEWLIKVTNDRCSRVPQTVGSQPASLSSALLDRGTRAEVETEGSPERVYRCQATQMFAATLPMRWWDLRQYWRDLKCGNVTVGHMLRAAAIAHVTMVRKLLRRGVLPKLRIGGPLRGKTPAESLHLHPGELVQVKTREEIVATLNQHAKNRGLRFDVEMIRYCGTRRRVLRRVEQIIDERTGRMMKLPNDCLILEGATCVGDRSPNRLFCPRAIFPYWREIWLRRVGSPAASGEEVGSSHGQ
jgi:hypothetical protein